MPTARSRVITLAALLCFFGLLMFATWPSKHPHPPAHAQAAGERGDQTANENGGEKPKESFWRRTVDDPIALFTGALTIFTAVLAGVSAVQFYFIIRADRTARDSADAAQLAAKAADLSAQAAIGVALPSLHIERLGPMLADEAFDIWIRHLGIRIDIRNYGKTPAFVTDVILNVHLSKDELPTSPVYKPFYRFRKRFVVDGGACYSFDDDSHINPFTKEDIEAIAAGAIVLQVYGVIRYRDFLDAAHECGFLFLYVADNKEFIPEHWESDYYYQR